MRTRGNCIRQRLARQKAKKSEEPAPHANEWKLAPWIVLPIAAIASLLVLLHVVKRMSEY